MKSDNLLFWNVDTQFDFVDPKGKLYVKDAELLKSNWAELTKLAEYQLFRVVNSCDFHSENSNEIDLNPDFIHTFPPHCIAGTPGSEFISETIPSNPFILDWDKCYDFMHSKEELDSYRNFIIRKDAFDVFSGNRNTEKLLKYLEPDIVIVYGVTTNVCVDYAVTGLSKRGIKVYVISDAVKELLNIPLPYEKWMKLGVRIINKNEFIKEFKIKKGS